MKDNNKVENDDNKENCKKVEDKVKNKSGSDLEGNDFREREFGERWRNFKGNQIDTSAFIAVI